MRLYRPHVPLLIQCLVAQRQLNGEQRDIALRVIGGVAVELGRVPSHRFQLGVMLLLLFGEGVPAQLDHNPPLMLRERRWKPKRGWRYTPDANDPDYLIWRTAEDHRIKTFVRGDGAQLSDAGKRRKEIRRRNRETRPRRKWPSRRIPSRPMR